MFVSRQERAALLGGEIAYVRSKRNEIPQHVWETGRGLFFSEVQVSRKPSNKKGHRRY